MPTPPERTPHTPEPGPAAGNEEITLPPESSASDTAPHPTSARERLPSELPAPFGRYQLLKLLGEGGMGRVYLAHDSQLDRPVALKVPLFGPEDPPALLERFYREARAAATVLHANVCPVYDVGQIDGVPYLTMAFIEGKPLAEFAARPLAPKQAAFLVRKLALALAEAHKRGVIHRDLKPANVMVNRQGEPVVMDFGLARRAKGGDARLTRQGAFLGTPAYAPPEQVSGEADNMGPACDVYSLGVILYELLAGRLPFEGDALLVVSRVLLEEPPPPSQFRPGLDPELEAICLKAMAKKPEQRYASMATFAGALQEYLRGKAPAGAPAPAPLPATDVVVLEPPAARAGDAGGPRSGKRLRGGPTDRKPAPPPTEALPPPRPRRRPRGQRGVPVWGWVVGGAGAALVVLAVLGVVAYRLAFYGTVRFDPGEAGGDAELRVDGEARSWGEALRLRTGEHRLEASAPGFLPLREPLVVHRGDNPTHRVRLEREQAANQFGAVRFEPSEAGAAVKLTVDGEAVPWGESLRLRAGEHQLEAAGDGYRTVRQPFTVRPGPNEPLVVQLRREPGGPGREAGPPLNALTAQEKASGWQLLFDGRTTAGWRGYGRETVPDHWRVEDGALVLRPGGPSRCDLVTADTYDNFELAFEWKVGPGGNSGVLYRVAEGPGEPYASGPEYQVLDNARNADGRRPETSAAACYGLYGPARDVTRPAGEWNQARIVANGFHVEHWLNGEKVVEYELGSPDWWRRVRATRFKNAPLYGKVLRGGRLDLQDHGDPVAYRNLKVRRLP
jgi:hypothetical protein